MLFNIATNKWDKQILDILKIPSHMLPEVKDSSDDFGHTDPKITGESFFCNWNGGRSTICNNWTMLF